MLHALLLAFLFATARVDEVSRDTEDGISTALDIDGSGTADAFTDGLLILRYLFGLRSDALIANAVDPMGKRVTAMDIDTYIQSLMP